MTTIILEETSYSKYASQGGTPSGQHGYDIWLYMGDGSQTFLGFITPDRFYDTMIEYLETGSQVFVRPSNR